MTLTIIGKRIFADVIELKISRWVHPGLSRWVLNPMTGVLFRERQEGDSRQKRSGERDCFLKNKYQHRCLLHLSKSLRVFWSHVFVLRTRPQRYLGESTVWLWTWWLPSLNPFLLLLHEDHRGTRCPGPRWGSRKHEASEAVQLTGRFRTQTFLVCPTQFFFF